MVNRSIWFSSDNENYLQTKKGSATLNAVINALVTQARLAEQSADGYLVQIVRDYAPIRPSTK